MTRTRHVMKLIGAGETRPLNLPPPESSNLSPPESVPQIVSVPAVSQIVSVPVVSRTESAPAVSRTKSAPSGVVSRKVQKTRKISGVKVYRPRKYKPTKRAVLNGSARGRVHRTQEQTALREIKFYSDTVGHLIPRAAFGKLIRDVLANVDMGGGLRIQASALWILQESAEKFLTGYLSASNKCASHARRKTLMQQDMHLLKDILQQAPSLLSR